MISGKKILFLTPRFPFPLIGGDRVKPYHLIKYLCKNNEVTLVTFYQGKKLNSDYIKEIENLGVKVYVVEIKAFKSALAILFKKFWNLPLEIAFYKNSKFQNLVNQLIDNNKFDLAFSFFMRTAEFIKDKKIPKVLIAEDCRTVYQHRSFKETKKIIQKMVRMWESYLLSKYEPYISDFFDAVTLVTYEDIDAMRKMNNEANYFLLTNGTDLNRYCLPKINEERDGVLFAAKFDIWANVLMIDKIIKEILPIIRQKVPDFKFVFAGANPSEKLRNFIESNNCELYENVPDLAPYM